MTFNWIVKLPVFFIQLLVEKLSPMALNTIGHPQHRELSTGYTFELAQSRSAKKTYHWINRFEFRNWKTNKKFVSVFFFPIFRVTSEGT